MFVYFERHAGREADLSFLIRGNFPVDDDQGDEATFAWVSVSLGTLQLNSGRGSSNP